MYSTVSETAEQFNGLLAKQRAITRSYMNGLSSPRSLTPDEVYATFTPNFEHWLKTLMRRSHQERRLSDSQPRQQHRHGRRLQR
jgi:hypothetical protein